jgi:hypothetical protein
VIGRARLGSTGDGTTLMKIKVVDSFGGTHTWRFNEDPHCGSPVLISTIP